MQILSPGSMAAVLAAGPDLSQLQELLQHPRIPQFGPAFVAIQVGLQILSVLGTWGASRLLVEREKATFLNALKCWGLYLLLVISIGFVLGILLTQVAKFHEAWRIQMVGVGGAGMLVLILILIPMKIYGIGAFRAIGVYLLSSVFAGVGFFIVGGAVFAGLGRELMAVQWQNVITQTQQVTAPTPEPIPTIGSPEEVDQMLNAALHPFGAKPTLAEREATARLLQQKLEARRLALAPGDKKAKLVYQNQLFRYLAYLDEVKAERRLHPEAPAH